MTSGRCPLPKRSSPLSRKHVDPRAAAAEAPGITAVSAARSAGVAAGIREPVRPAGTATDPPDRGRLHRRRTLPQHHAFLEPAPAPGPVPDRAFAGARPRTTVSPPGTRA